VDNPPGGATDQNEAQLLPQTNAFVLLQTVLIIRLHNGHMTVTCEHVSYEAMVNKGIRTMQEVENKYALGAGRLQMCASSCETETYAVASDALTLAGIHCKI
jgi:hypothetical protein